MTEVVALDTAFLGDPHRLFTRLREREPVCVAELPGGERFWLVTRYEDVRAVLTDPAIGKDAAGLLRAQGLPGPTADSMQTHMLNSDPPDHTRLRRLISKVFTGRAVERLRPRITELADDLIAAVAAHDEVDLLAEFAYPLPLTVICELLGVDTDDRDDFRRWSTTIAGTGTLREMRDASARMRAYLVSSIARKRARPRSDLLSELVHARDGSDALSERELVSTSFLLLFAGHETTVNLIASGTLALLRNPDQWAALRADRSLIPGAIEEFPALREPGEPHLVPIHQARHANRRRRHSRGRIRRRRTGVGQSRRRPLRRPRRRADLPAGRWPPGLRPRHPLLPRRTPGPVGRGDRVRPVAHRLPRPVPRRRSRSADLARKRAHSGADTLPVRLRPTRG